jgi:RNA polymerase sigma factor (sigma-70 family)
LISATSPILCHHGQTIESCGVCRQRTHTQLVTNIDTLLADARPRLLRLTRMNGIPQDIADDVVQETLMEAWRHIENLHTAERFSAWLDGICRNVCRRQARTQATLSRQNASLTDLRQDTEHEHDDAPSFDIPDPQAIDPAELLNREDMATLLNRALAYLPAETRELVELCYLAELPQREVAAQLGMATGALELRLHRARKLLRQVLNGELRAEAEAFGILDAEQSSGWQETRQWCWLCGRQRMRGIFERQSDGTINLRVRCPDCSNRYDMDIINTSGLVSMNGLQSFRPAIKRVFQSVPRLYLSSLQESVCPFCKASTRTSVNVDSIPIHNFSIPGRVWLVSYCANCGFCVTDVVSILLSNPEVMNFALHHTRLVSEPIQWLEYAGRQTLCARLTDMTSAERLTILADPEPLEIVAMFKK